MTDIDWRDLAGKVIGLGAPLLGGALGGPLGSAAGRILADALGAAEPTPAATAQAITAADPAAAQAAARTAEARWQAALAEVGRAQVAEVAATQRAEIASGDPVQRWWRPLYAIELSLIECPAFALTMLRALWIGHDKGIEGFATLSALLMTYFAARFGVLGVYVTGRSREKQAIVTGELAPSAIEQITKALMARKR